jgi:alpha-D-ribose 1-methylphosphonate 5-triphosphate diphosphatase PhnM
LNDVHKATGGAKQHQPSNFMRLDTTKALIAEINHSSHLRSAVSVVNGGPRRGTYVVKALVYAYSMWVSPAMSLMVINTYDDYTQGKLVSATQHLSQYVAYQFALADKNAQDAIRRLPRLRH